jgi:alkylation response protein AidB-like acyl-CoA dehydrogenase
VDFALNAEQTELRTHVLGFARSRLAEGVLDRDRGHRFCRETWDAMGAHGLLGLSVPARWGGLGLSALDTAIAVEALGEGCPDAGLVFSASAHLFAAVMPIVEGGDDALRDAVVPDLASGRLIGANAITEAEAGSDVFALKTRAVREGDTYVLDGVKSYVTNGPVADLFLVYATTNPAWGMLGVTAFVVRRDTPGLVVGEPFEKMGLRTSPIASLYLDGCRVPASSRLGEEGDGASLFTRSMHWERACLFAGYVGAMQRQLGQAIDHARARKQFKVPIGKNQAISHRIVDMKLRLDAARLLLYRACWERDRGRDAGLEVSLAKIAISEAAVQSGLDLIQVFGGYGYTVESGIERALRDAIPATLFSGTSEMQREIAARELGL